MPHNLWKCTHPKLVAARATFSEDAKQAHLKRILIENVDLLPFFLQHGIPPPLALLPNAPWWTNIADSCFAREPNQTQAVFGIDQSYHHDGPFMTWLEPYLHLDGKRAFADINGSGHLADFQGLPMTVCVVQHLMSLMFLLMAPSMLHSILFTL